MIFPFELVSIFLSSAEGEGKAFWRGQLCFPTLAAGLLLNQLEHPEMHVDYAPENFAEFTSDVSVLGAWGPFLESPGNLLGPISVFGDKCFLTKGKFC